MRVRRVGGRTQKKWGPEGWGPEGWGGPKFRAFFSLSRRKIRSFLPSLGGLLVEFWWCLKRGGAQMCTFGVLWLSCEAPAARSGGAGGVSHGSPRAQTCTFERPGTKIQREDPEREERKKFPARERKKRAKFWAVQGKGGPAKGGPAKGGPGQGGPGQGGPGQGGPGNP